MDEKLLNDLKKFSNIVKNITMRNFLFISLFLLPIIGFGQKNDSIGYCEVCVINHAINDWGYNIYNINPDGSLKSDELNTATSEVHIFQELGTKGWHFVSQLPFGDQTGYQSEHYITYMFEKVYKKD